MKTKSTTGMLQNAIETGLNLAGLSVLVSAAYVLCGLLQFQA